MRYMDIEEQVDADFARARRRAFVRRMRARLREGAIRAGLRSFEEIRKAKGAYNGVRLGTRSVPVGRVTHDNNARGPLINQIGPTDPSATWGTSRGVTSLRRDAARLRVGCHRLRVP